MNYSRVYIDSLGYELAPVVVTSQELEERLRPLYQSLPARSADGNRRAALVGRRLPCLPRRGGGRPQSPE